MFQLVELVNQVRIYMRKFMYLTLLAALAHRTADAMGEQFVDFDVTAM